MLWPKDRRDYVRKCIMDEKEGQLNNFTDYVKSHPISENDNFDVEEFEKLRKECDEWKLKFAELEKTLRAKTEESDKWKKKYEELGDRMEPEKAFNALTGKPCFTSRQMGVLLTAVGRITEKENPPGKTTFGEVTEKIAGYMATTASSNMKGKIPKTDTEAVAIAIESKFPNLAAEVRKV